MNRNCYADDGQQDKYMNAARYDPRDQKRRPQEDKAAIPRGLAYSSLVPIIADILAEVSALSQASVHGRIGRPEAAGSSQNKRRRRPDGDEQPDSRAYYRGVSGNIQDYSFHATFFISFYLFSISFC
jgi:hypothetical protein